MAISIKISHAYIFCPVNPLLKIFPIRIFSKAQRYNFYSTFILLSPNYDQNISPRVAHLLTF